MAMRTRYVFSFHACAIVHSSVANDAKHHHHHGGSLVHFLAIYIFQFSPDKLHLPLPLLLFAAPSRLSGVQFDASAVERG